MWNSSLSGTDIEDDDPTGWRNLPTIIFLGAPAAPASPKPNKLRAGHLPPIISSRVSRPLFGDREKVFHRLEFLFASLEALVL